MSRFRGRRPPGLPTGVGAHARRGLAFPCTPARPEPRGAALRRASPPPSASARSTDVGSAPSSGLGPPSNPNSLYGSRSLQFSKVSAISAAGLRTPRGWCSVGYLRDQSRTVVNFCSSLGTILKKDSLEGIYKVYIRIRRLRPWGQLSINCAYFTEVTCLTFISSKLKLYWMFSSYQYLFSF